MKTSNWTRLVLWILAGVLFMTAGVIPLCTAQAQGETSLAVDPDVSEAPLGNEVSLQLVVADGLDVNAYDLTIEYDEEKLELLSWEHGDYLSNLTVIKQENQSGYLRLAVTQLATPAVSGDGVLLELVFVTKEAGTASVEITEVEFADSDGNLTYPESVPGEVLVTGDPTYTITATTTDSASKGTQTPTPTRTPTRTRTPTKTRTVTPTRTNRYTRTATATKTATENLDYELAAEESNELSMDVTETEIPDQAQEDAYPSQGTPTPVSISGAEDHDDELSGQDQDSSAASDQDDDLQVADGGAAQAKWMNLFLWGVLIAGLIAIAMMLIVLIRRQKDKQEDLLL